MSAIGNKRHCWECRSKLLVCDFTLPACNRCTSAGIACPGYGDQKPARFKWVATGEVKSRKRKPKGISPAPPEKYSSDTVGKDAKQDLTSADTTLLRIEPRTESCDIYEAVQYYNTCIYQDLLPVNTLGRNPHVYLISPQYCQIGTQFPAYVKLSLVCMAIGYRINQSRSDDQHHPLDKTYYQHRGIIIRSLSQAIAAKATQADDVVLVGTISLLLCDLQQGALSAGSWRHHLEGAEKLIALRGGTRAFAQDESFASLLLCYASVAVLGNTTSPATDMAMNATHLDDILIIVEKYGMRIFTLQMCPPSIFAEIARINVLRMKATTCQPTEFADLTEKAYEILRRINAFSPEPWATSKPSSKEDWTLMGTIYRISAVLYCIHSLQSVSVLPLHSSLRESCALNGVFLRELVSDAFSRPWLCRVLTWPLVVLGVEAAHGGAEIRALIPRYLVDLSRTLGTHVPLMAKEVLEKFWASGATRWDICFDKPYAFVAHLAIDISSLFEKRLTLPSDSGSTKTLEVPS